MEALTAGLILSFAIVYLVVRIVAFVAAFWRGKRARQESQAPESKPGGARRAQDPFVK